MAELQLEDYNDKLLVIRELQETHTHSFMALLSEQQQEELRAFKGAHGQSRSVHVAPVDLSGVHEDEVTTEINRLKLMEARYEEHKHLARDRITGLEKSSAKLQAEKEQAEGNLTLFQSEMQRFFQEHQNNWDMERERLEAELAEARQAQRQWEDHLRTQSPAHKV